MTSSPLKLSNLSLYTAQSAFCLITLLLLACDPGKLSICEFQNTPECQPTSSSPGLEPGLDTPQNLPKPIATSLTFVPHYVFVSKSKTQFAGVVSNESIIREQNTRLLKITAKKDGTIGFTTQDADLAVRFPSWYEPARDRIYFAGRFAYFVQYQSNETLLYNMDNVKDPFWKSPNSPRGPSVRSFFDQHTNSFAVEARPETGKTCVKLQLAGNPDSYCTNVVHSSYVIGDLDKIDDEKNGLDFIAFSQSEVDALIHRLPGTDKKLSDLALAEGLENSIKSKHPSASISAACITDINNDGRQELIYAIGGTVHAITYHGRTWLASGRAFQQWPQRALFNINKPDQSISSISTIDLNGDKYPELVIETKDYILYFITVANEMS